MIVADLEDGVYGEGKMGDMHIWGKGVTGSLSLVGCGE